MSRVHREPNTFVNVVWILGPSLDGFLSDRIEYSADSRVLIIRLCDDAFTERQTKLVARSLFGLAVLPMWSTLHPASCEYLRALSRQISQDT
jgi:hypothetical protein